MVPGVLDKMYGNAFGLYLTNSTNSNSPKLFYPVAFSTCWETNLECYGLDMPGNSFWDVCPQPLAFSRRNPTCLQVHEQDHLRPHLAFISHFVLSLSVEVKFVRGRIVEAVSLRV